MSGIPFKDFRGETKDGRRFEDQKEKGNKRARAAAGKVCNHPVTWRAYTTNTCANCTKRSWPHERPLGPDACYTNSRRAHNHGRKAVLKEASAALEEHSDTSASDDAYEGPEDDAFMYSYDAQRGPTTGSQILLHALDQAVEYRENKETEKIVREYDLVADGEDELDFATAEDDFELVDTSKL